jgi:predicted nucleic acid-binding protein
LSRAIADTSVFIAQESGRELGDLPKQIAVSVVTAAELELGVLSSDPQPLLVSSLDRGVQPPHQPARPSQQI